MTLPIPFTFATQSGSVPASELDNNFSAVNTSLTTPLTIASATTTDLGTILSNNIQITGTGNITSFGSSAVATQPLYFLEFTGAATLNYNATNLILPTSANITTAAGDSAVAWYLGSGNWRVLAYYPFSGQALASSGSSGTIKSVKIQKFTSSGTYTPSTGMVYAVIDAVGGGGGAPGGSAGSNYASGGGAGAYVRSLVTAANVGASQVVTIGAAGTASTGNTAAGNGGNTSVGTLAVAGGGTAGTQSSSSITYPGGLGGTATTPANGVGVNGQNGGAGQSNGALTGFGGSGPFGAGGYGVTSGTAGVAGSGFGAGGSGANSTNLGGAGSPGFVLITEYCTV